MQSGVINIGLYTVISVKCKETSSCSMNWWIRRAELDLSADTNDELTSRSLRSIKVLGVPVFVTAPYITKLFKPCGAIQNVTKVEKNSEAVPEHLPKFSFTNGTNSVVIRFRSLDAVEKALKLIYSGNYVLYEQTEKVPPMTKVWSDNLWSNYNIDCKKLVDDCTKYMENYDKQRAETLQNNRKLAETPDEDGWVTVTKTKFYKPPKALKKHEYQKLKKRKKDKTLLHFYKHTVSDAKMERIRNLKARFEDDKKKISQMRQQRKFKPF